LSLSPRASIFGSRRRPPTPLPRPTERWRIRSRSRDGSWIGAKPACSRG